MRSPKLRLGGIIIYGGRRRSEFIMGLASSYPTVLLGGRTHRVKLDSIWVDNADGIEQAVSYLVERGHRNIGFLNSPIDTPTSWEKQTGFSRAVAQADPPIRGYSVTCTGFSPTETFDALERLLGLAPDITAVIAGEIDSGLAIPEFFMTRGKAIPEEMSLIVFRDDPHLEEISPPLTAIGFPSIDISRETLRCLVQRIHSPQAQVRRILFKPYIVERGSVGVIPT